jgi:hypothetical protein
MTSLAVIEPVSCRLERPPSKLLIPELEEESLRPEPRLGIRDAGAPRPLSLLDPPREPRLLRSPGPLLELGRREARAPRPVSLPDPPSEPSPLRPLPELGMREDRAPRPPNWRFSMVLVGAPRAAPTRERATTVFMMTKERENSVEKARDQLF